MQTEEKNSENREVEPKEETVYESVFFNLRIQ